MGGVVQAVTKPVAKLVGAAAPAASPVAAIAQAVEKKPEPTAVGQARAEQEMAGALSGRRKRGRASTVLGASDDTAAAQTATKTLLGQ